MIGKIHSIQSLGTLDGPGIRFVVFMQGCNLRCHCCHNPDTWEVNNGKEISDEDLINKAIRYKEYFKDNGGITVSGGEPLLQAKFVYEVFKKAHENNINTCLDTSGCILNEDIKLLLSHTDKVLLDIKYCNDDLYQKYV
ncbi:MAG: 4Fe-4S cluster-binding domain-containing protein, partial [Bacilli bacterium]|nr:4Fe-4S cluster-binding domain-containing protein [Bacilli bacterium]